jgi:mono/diheme cytochrome c family protein
MSKRLPEDEINFADLLKNPKRLFGFSYIYFLGILIIAGIFYVKHIDDISINEVPISYLDSLNIERDITQKKGGIMPAVDLAKVKSPDEAMLTSGKELYEANCSSCHASNGNGQGPAGVALNPAPRNFLEPGAEWTNGNTFFDMYKTLQEGILQNGMAAYEYLSPEDRVSIIHYVRTFAEYPEITDEEVNQRLDATYNLSAGTVVPNQIPVKKSIVILENEFNSILQNPEYLSYLKSNSNSKGALLLHKYSTNSEIIIRSSTRGEISSDINDFIKSVSLAPVDFGFKASVVEITMSDWQNLHTYLLGLANLNNS